MGSWAYGPWRRLVHTGQRPGHGPVRARRCAGVALLLTLAATGGCGGDGGGELPPPASPPAASSPVASVDPEHREILDVYYGAVAAQVAAQGASDPDHPALQQYFIERTPALRNIQNTILRHESRGAHYAGEIVVVDATVTEIDHDSVPARATIEACLDDSDYHLVFRGDGSPVPDAVAGGRHAATAGALLGTDDQWYIVESTSHWDETC